MWRASWGRVTDSSGAVIPNAAVTVKNELTGQSRKLAANGQGYYRRNPTIAGSVLRDRGGAWHGARRVQGNSVAGRPGANPEHHAPAHRGQHRGQRLGRRSHGCGFQLRAHRRQCVPARSVRAAHERAPGFPALPARARRRQQRRRKLRQYPLQRTLQPGKRDPFRRRRGIFDRRRVSGQPQRRDDLAVPPRAEPRKRPGIPRGQQQLSGRVRNRHGRPDQLYHQVRHQLGARVGLRLHPQRRLRCAQFLRRRDQVEAAAEPVRRLGRRPDHPGQDVLLRQL